MAPVDVAEPRRRSRRRWWRATALAAAAGAAALGAGAGYLWSLPGVGDAAARSAAILARHHALAWPGRPPVRLAAAVVSTEDEHFYSNFVVNTADGAGRAAPAALHARGDPGGSTISQQLAKRLYGDGGSVAQIGLGVKLSLRYPKWRILAMYLDSAYYGHGYWGERAAAAGYFATTPDRLDWADAALLAGLLQAPNAYDPVDHPGPARLRRAHVLRELLVNHVLTATQSAAAAAQPLLPPRRARPPTGQP